jgi:hypothetical protein
MRGAAALAAWTGPALVVAVVARVTTGGVEAPLFVLAVLAAPLLAWLAGPWARAAPAGLPLVVGLVVAACALGAGLRILVDLGHLLGVETGVTLGASIVLVLGVTTRSRGDGVVVGALALGSGALVAAVIALGVIVDTPPWLAWARVASHGGFELGPHSPWTGEGGQVLEPITLTFTEPHRVTSVAAGLYHVIERDRGTSTVRERRLAAGDSLMLRPGDSLAVPAGARLRFEAGKRLPGAPESGVAWADRPGVPRARLMVEWVGLVVTLTGGAIALLRPTSPLSRPAVLAGPVTVLAVVWAATCWGIYAVATAPELSIGAPPVAALARLGRVVSGEPRNSRLVAAVVVALVALLLASAGALRRRLAELAALESGRLAAPAHRAGLGAAVWGVLLAAAAAGSVAVVDAWSLLLQGAGLAAATLVGPLLATGDAAHLDRARAAGALTGALLFVGPAAAAHWLWPSSAAVLEYPALVAVPGAWLVAALVRREKVARARRR